AGSGAAGTARQGYPGAGAGRQGPGRGQGRGAAGAQDLRPAGRRRGRGGRDHRQAHHGRAGPSALSRGRGAGPDSPGRPAARQRRRGHRRPRAGAQGRHEGRAPHHHRPRPAQHAADGLRRRAAAHALPPARGHGRRDLHLRLPARRDAGYGPESPSRRHPADAAPENHLRPAGGAASRGRHHSARCGAGGGRDGDRAASRVRGSHGAAQRRRHIRGHRRAGRDDRAGSRDDRAPAEAPRALPAAGDRSAQGRAPPWPSGHGQDADRPGRGRRGRRAVLSHRRARDHGPLSRRKRAAAARRVRAGAEERALYRLHRRDRQHRPQARGGHGRGGAPHRGPAADADGRAGAAAERGGDRRHQPAQRARRGAAPAGALRPRDRHRGARHGGPARDPFHPHARHAASRRRGPGRDRPHHLRLRGCRHVGAGARGGHRNAAAPPAQHRPGPRRDPAGDPGAADRLPRRLHQRPEAGAAVGGARDHDPGARRGMGGHRRAGAGPDAAARGGGAAAEAPGRVPPPGHPPRARLSALRAPGHGQDADRQGRGARVRGQLHRRQVVGPAEL
ncbi:MAG: AAA family ATPase Cdc48, partial [uncultured Gemmatimonadetes bacterium]